MLLVSGDDGTNQLVAYHVTFVEIDDRNAGNVFQRLKRFDHTGTLVRGQIDLRHIAGDHALGIRTDAREQHEHLLGGGVLRFIENHECIVQSAAAHVSQRRDFDSLPRNRALDFLRLEHVAERVVKRTQIRSDLLFELARQKSKRLTGFHCRSSQNNSAHLIFL